MYGGGVYILGIKSQFKACKSIEILGLGLVEERQGEEIVFEKKKDEKLKSLIDKIKLSILEITSLL